MTANSNGRPLPPLRLALLISLLAWLGALGCVAAGAYALWKSWIEEADRRLLGTGRQLIESTRKSLSQPTPNPADRADESRGTSLISVEVFSSDTLSGETAEYRIISVMSPDAREPVTMHPWPEAAMAALREGGEFKTRTVEGKPWRVMGLISGGWKVRMALDISEIHAEAGRFAWKVGGASLAVPILVFLLTWSLLRRHASASESRIQAAMNQSRRFSADAAHELRTPLAVLQGRLEVALQAPERKEEDLRLLADLSEQSRRLKEIVEALLLLARSDAGGLVIEKRPITLKELVQPLLEDAEGECAEANLRFKHTLDPGISLEADVRLLRLALSNLLRNAISYNFPDGFVEFEAGGGIKSVAITVTNSGPPILEEEQAVVFDRFQRGAAAKSGAMPGQGLGLSLARAIISAHGGTLALIRSDPSATEFRVSLPLRTVGEK